MTIKFLKRCRNDSKNHFKESVTGIHLSHEQRHKKRATGILHKEPIEKILKLIGLKYRRN